MKKEIRWGILSTGNIAHKFAATATRMHDKIIVSAVASRDKEKARTFSQEFQIPKAYGSYEEMLEDPEIDVIYIATPHSHHYEHIRICLEHNKHVLCEKSITINADQAQKAFNLAQEKGLFLMEAFWTKFCPIYRDVDRLLSDHIIGDLHLVTAQFGFRAKESNTSRKLIPELGGGALLDIGVYAIGFASMILGYHPIKVHSLVHMNQWGTDSMESLLLQYKNGAVAQLNTSIQTVMPIQGMIYGSKGRIELPDFKSPTILRVIPNDGEAYEIRKPFEVNGFEYEIREVEKCLRNKQITSTVMAPEHSIAVQKIMDQLRLEWGFTYPFE